jgi:nucleoside-diphosphate-sugar epimerase
MLYCLIGDEVLSLSVRRKPMKVLILGGSGYIAGMLIPELRRKHEIRIFDVVPPEDPSLEYFQGSVTDATAVRSAMDGIDAMVYMAMGARDRVTKEGLYDVNCCYDVNVKGLHIALDAAVSAGVTRVVHASSISVYGYTRKLVMRPLTENDPVLPYDNYALTKSLGEDVCRYFNSKFELPIIVLRLFMPVPVEKLVTPPPGNWHYDLRTALPDLVRLFMAAIESDVQGCPIINTVGESSGKYFSLKKAQDLLGWVPRERD